MDKIKTFIESDTYNKLLNKVRSRLKIEINEQSPPIAMLNYDLSFLKASNLSIGTISDTISMDDRIYQFIVSKVMFYSNQGEEDNNE